MKRACPAADAAKVKKPKKATASSKIPDAFVPTYVLKSFTRTASAIDSATGLAKQNSLYDEQCTIVAEAKAAITAATTVLAAAKRRLTCALKKQETISESLYLVEKDAPSDIERLTGKLKIDIRCNSNSDVIEDLVTLYVNDAIDESSLMDLLNLVGSASNLDYRISVLRTFSAIMAVQTEKFRTVLLNGLRVLYKPIVELLCGLAQTLISDASVWLPIFSVVLTNETEELRLASVERLVVALIANIPYSDSLPATVHVKVLESSSSKPCPLLSIFHPVVNLLKKYPALSSCCRVLETELFERLAQLAAKDSEFITPSYALPDEAERVGKSDIKLRDFLLSPTETLMPFDYGQIRRAKLHALIDSIDSYPRKLSHQSSGYGRDRAIVVAKISSICAAEFARVEIIKNKRAEIQKLLQTEGGFVYVSSDKVIKIE
jgi:hypothetical protein